LFERQNEANFAEIFDNTLLDIAKENSDMFSVVTEGGEKIVLFENISKYVTESGRAALKFGFEVLGLTEIWGTCHEENIASRKSLEKCGLRFVDQILYKNEIVCDRLKITREELEAVAK